MKKQFVCLRCGGIAIRHMQSIQDVCEPCSFEHSMEGNKASSIVAKAIRNGVLEPANKKTCVDCGKPASVHDHRDYLKPLDVDPVCKSCNSRRGMAMDSKLRVFPKDFIVPTIRKSVTISESSIPQLRYLIQNKGRAWLEKLISREYRKATKQ